MPEMTPITASFGEDGNKALRTYVHENIMSLKTRLDTLHQEKINKWRRLYRGVPKQEIKNFPWKNASNVIIQLIGENCDIIRARILGTIFEVMPLWVTSLVGDWSTEAHGGEQQEAIQEFMNYVGLEPGELDLYRVESQGVDEQIKFGTVLYALPWVRDVEAQVVGQMFGKAKFRDFTKYEGPRPEKVEFESWGATPSAATLEAADFKYRKLTLTKQKLEERFFRGIFKFEHLKEGETQETLKEAFLSNPDRPGPSNVQSEKERDRGISH